MRTRNQRGAALAWAMFLLAVVATAIAVCGGALATRFRLARLATEAGAMEDLRASALALGRVRAASPGWRGPESLEIAGGTASVRLDCLDEHAALHIEVRARLTGRTATSVEPLASHAPCRDPA